MAIEGAVEEAAEEVEEATEAEVLLLVSRDLLPNNAGYEQADGVIDFVKKRKIK